MSAWLAAVLIMASVCPESPDGFCRVASVDVPLVYGQPVQQVHLAVVLGDSLVVELGEAIELERPATLGNGAMFLMRPSEDGRVLTVWPKMPKGARARDLINQMSNVQLDLKSGIRVLITLRVVDENSAVQRVRLRFPELVRERQRFREEAVAARVAAEEEIARAQARLTQDAESYALRSLAARAAGKLRCREIDKHDTGLFRLSVDRACVIGDLLLISYRLRNGKRSTVLRISEVKVEGAQGSRPIEASSEDLVTVGNAPEDQLVELAFGQGVRRAAAVVLPGSGPSTFALEMTTDTGEILRVDGIQP